MVRDFCLYCGALLATDEHGVRLPCSCPASPEEISVLEQQEREHLAEYARARPLEVPDLDRLVRTEFGELTVWELLSRSHQGNFLRELGMRATARAVVQLVYERQRGSRLLRWRFKQRPTQGG